MWLFDICKHYEMVISTKLINTPILFHGYLLWVCELRTFKFYSPSKFQVYNTVLLTILTMYYISRPYSPSELKLCTL